MPDHAHPENASIRELQTVKDELLEAMAAMETRITARIDGGHDGLERRIDEAFHVHAEEHGEMVERANLRHSKIDSFLTSVSAAEYRAQGRSTFIANVFGILRAVNEFRWIIAAVVIGALALLGDLSVNFNAH